MKKRRVILESPYKGKSEDKEVAKLETIRNLEYARACMRDCALRGESAYASHLLLTQDGVLDDNIPDERSLGIELGFVWREVALESIFCIDFGISGGMKLGIESAQKDPKHLVTYRALPPLLVQFITERHAKRLARLERKRAKKTTGAQR